MKNLILAITAISFSANAQFTYTEDPPSKHLVEGELLFKKWNKIYRLNELLMLIQNSEKNPSLELRTMKYYSDTIYLKFDPPFGLQDLRNGVLPYFVKGDFDCDRIIDQALTLSNNSTYVVMGSGTIINLRFGGESITLEKPGKRKTIKGKGYGIPKEDPMPAEFNSKCDFITGSIWEKASIGYIYDGKKEAFISYITSD